MQVLYTSGSYTYIAETGDWRIVVGNGAFEIRPQVGAWEYSSGINLDNLAALIVSAKAHAIENGVNWSGN
jgi:hypothetical protein